MSQCYQITLKASVSRRVNAEESVSYPIELTEILPPEQMAALLEEILEREGWQKAGDGSRRFTTTGDAGETISIDLDTMEVTATIAVDKEVAAEVEVTGLGERRASAKRRAKTELDERSAAVGDQIEEAGRRSVQQEVARRLEESESARLRQLNELVQQVYSESLKKKAAQLGDIVEVTESTSEDGNYELVIRVTQ